MALSNGFLLALLAAAALSGAHGQAVIAPAYAPAVAPPLPTMPASPPVPPVSQVTFSEATLVVNVPVSPPCTTVLQALAGLNLTTAISFATKTGLLSTFTAANQTLLVPLDSAYTRHFASNTTLYTRGALLAPAQASLLSGLVLYGIIPGAFPTSAMYNLQRLYGLLPGVNVALKVPPRGVKQNIRVLGIFGNTVANITRKNIPTCGGGYIHVLDSVVLPYTL